MLSVDFNKRPSCQELLELDYVRSKCKTLEINLDLDTATQAFNSSVLDDEIQPPRSNTEKLEQL